MCVCGQLYRQAINMRSDFVEAYINRGDILLKLDRTTEAKQLYEVALVHAPDHADINYNVRTPSIYHSS